MSATLSGRVPEPRIVAITGGVGGAKLVLGLDRSLPPGDLAAIVNTGDDFEHLGLSICPDLDTTLYTLANLANPELGWGRAGETWSFMESLGRINGDTWFKLGDHDLALHVERTRRLKKGESLTEVMCSFAEALAVGSAIIPMSDEPIRTLVETTDGLLAFQDYFVRLRCAPVVRSIRFSGAGTASPAAAALGALASPRLECIIVCPSNPYLSIDPILAMPALRDALVRRRVPAVVVSPLIGSQAVKGPTAKIMQDLALEVSSLTIARHYETLMDGIVIDTSDGLLAGSLGVPTHVTPTLMTTLDEKRRLASTCLEFAGHLRPATASSG